MMDLEILFWTVVATSILAVLAWGDSGIDD